MFARNMTRGRAVAVTLVLALGLAAAAQEAPAPAPAPGSLSTGVCPKLPSGAANASPVNPSYEFGNYASFGDVFATIPLSFPAGAAGAADVAAVTAEFAATRAAKLPPLQKTLAAMDAACPEGSCLTSLEAFDKVYAAMPADIRRVALAGFGVGPNADAAFARMRLTTAPMLIKRVPSYADLPIKASEIEGLDDIIADTGLSLRELVEAGRVFAVDFTPFGPALAPSPGGWMEAPVALFFVDGPGKGAGKGEGAGKGSSRLMPLAIQFSVQNQNVYSPADSPADWLLAKAAFNAMDTSIHAGLHFVLNHFVAENVCIAAKRHLAADHPLTPLISLPCKFNSGIIPVGVKGLLSNVTGSFDRLLMVTGHSLSQQLTGLMKQYDWQGAHLDADLAARGVADIPGFAYADDAGAAYKALLEYATEVLRPFYGSSRKTGADAVAKDKQLQGFLAALGPGGEGAIPGFPAAKDIGSTAELAKIPAQLAWVMGVQHHTLNSNKAGLYDFVWPSSPSKLFGAPPASKGELTEADLLKILVPSQVTTPNGTVITGWQWFLQASQKGFEFRILPDVQPQEQLLNAYTTAYQPPKGCAAARALSRAALKLNARLRKASAAIQAREAKLAGDLPQYTLLDPQYTPFYTYT